MFKKNKIAAKDIFDLIDNGHLDDVKNWHKDNPEALNIIGTDYKCTPLIWAAWHGKNEILDYLIASGVDLDAQDKDHDQPTWRRCPHCHCGLRDTSATHLALCHQVIP